MKHRKTTPVEAKTEQHLAQPTAPATARLEGPSTARGREKKKEGREMDAGETHEDRAPA